MGAYVFVWVIGIYCCITFMKEYAYYLKPLFLAAVFVSLLESAVKFFETWMMRFARRLWKLVLAVAFQPAKCCGVDVGLRLRDVVRCREKEDTIVCPPLPGCIFLWVDSACWLLALVIVLILTILIFEVVWMTAGMEFTHFHDANRAKAYVMAGRNLTRCLISAAEELPTHIPLASVNNTNVTHWWSSSVENYTAHIDQHGAELLDKLEGKALSLFSGASSFTTGFISQVVFFFLYSLFWLFDPLAIMLGPSRPHKPEIDPRTHEFQEQPTSAAAGAAEAGCWPKWFTGGSSTLEEPLLGSFEFGVGATVQVTGKLRALKDEKGTPKVELDAGLEGVVERIDKHGHALIAFKPAKSGSQYELICRLFCDSEPAVKHWVARREREKLRAIKPATPPTRPTAAETVKIIQRYFRLKTFINFFTGLAYYCLFHFMEVDLAFILAVMAFYLGFIPELGFIVQVVVSLPVVVLSPARPDGLRPTLALLNLKRFVLGSFAIKFVINNVVETIIMKRDKILSQGGEEVHAVLILFLLALGGEIWGWVGMLLAVPGISLGRLMFRLADDKIRLREGFD